MKNHTTPNFLYLHFTSGPFIGIVHRLEVSLEFEHFREVTFMWSERLEYSPIDYVYMVSLQRKDRLDQEHLE